VHFLSKFCCYSLIDLRKICQMVVEMMEVVAFFSLVSVVVEFEFEDVVVVVVVVVEAFSDLFLW